MDPHRVASGAGGGQRALRMAQVPPQPPGPTSYLTLLAAALERAGAQVTHVEPAALWRLGRQRSVDLVHLHWLEFIAPSAPGARRGLARTLVRHARLVAVLVWLRLRGVKIVWTVHNLRPHEPVNRGWSTAGPARRPDQPRAGGAFRLRPDADPGAMGSGPEVVRHSPCQLHRAVPGVAPQPRGESVERSGSRMTHTCSWPSVRYAATSGSVTWSRLSGHSNATTYGC